MREGVNSHRFNEAGIVVSLNGKALSEAIVASISERNANAVFACWLEKVDSALCKRQTTSFTNGVTQIHPT